MQAIGRIYRAKTKTPCRQRVVYCQDTIEETICKNMKEKIETIAFLNDGKTDNYVIEGILDKNESSGDHEFSEYEKLVQKIQTLILKKDRLSIELKETINELQNLMFIKTAYGKELLYQK